MCHLLGPTIVMNRLKFLSELFVKSDPFLHEKLVDVAELLKLLALEVAPLSVNRNFVHYK